MAAYGSSRGAAGASRAASKNFGAEFSQLMDIFQSQASPKQRALMRTEAQTLFESALKSPNTIVKMPSGAIVEIPAGRAIPPNAQVLNKNADDLRAIFPTEIRPNIQQTTAVPPAGSRPVQPPPAAPSQASPFGPRPAPTRPSPRLSDPVTVTGLGGLGLYGGQTFDQAYPGQMERMTNELKGYLSEQGAQSTAGALALAEARKRQRPMSEVAASQDERTRVPIPGSEYSDVFNVPYDPAAQQRRMLASLPVYGGPSVDEVRSPPEPLPYMDADDDRAAAFRERLGSVGPAGSLPMMARRGGGEGQYTGIIDPSILMIARDRLMPYSMRREEAAAPAAPTISTPAGRSGSAGPRAASSTSTEASPAGGFLSGLFKDPYAGQSSQKLYEEYQKRQMAGDDDPAMYVRAARRELEERGRARGGSAEGSKHQKDAAVMKALEIIHHMLSNR
jgi:hypothetical protein